LKFNSPVAAAGEAAAEEAAASKATKGRDHPAIHPTGPVECSDHAQALPYRSKSLPAREIVSFKNSLP
jgi:hypothetical protein